jgi:hypothetical protein
MRWIVIALPALIFAGGLAHAAPKRDCGPKAAETVKQSDTIRVYYTKTGSARNYYACWRRTAGRPVELGGGTVRPPESVGRLRLRGRFLTYIFTSCGVGGCDFVIDVLDVAARRHIVSTDYLLGTVETLVATRGGAAAFLGDDGQGRYIQKLDSFGVEEIDRGSGVHELTLHRGRLHWMHGTLERNDHIAHVRRCGPATGDTEALSRNVRVYSTAPYNDDEYHHFACLLSGGRPLYLGADLPGHTAYSYHGDFEPIGRHVLWLEYECGPEDCLTAVHSADLQKRTQRKGRWSYQAPTIYPNLRGFAAELYSRTSTSPDYVLYGFDSTGENLLDKGQEIDPASIKVFADAVVWRNNGEQRSAPLR